MTTPFVVVSYGGGTDSTALLVEAHRRGIVPGAVIFSDTGSEMPHTYRYLDLFDAWLSAHGMPTITRVRWYRQDGSFVSIHEASLQRGEMPSRAYGYSGCSLKWKADPLDKHVQRALHPLARGWRPLERWVGYDATEDRRVKNLRAKEISDWSRWRAPLHEWGIDRSRCVEIIRSAGLPQPGKSSCFVCPSMRAPEVSELRRQYPHLYSLALRIEAAAMAHPNASGRPKSRGLGMNLVPERPWADLDSPEAPVDPEEAEDSLPCGCHDLRAEWRPPTRAYRPRPARLDRYRHLLGRSPDSEVARLAGVLPSVVGRMRRRMGIEAVGRCA